MKNSLALLAGAIPLFVSACASHAPSRAAALSFEGHASLFLPGIVSSEYSEVRVAISPDGATVLWGSTNRPGGPGGWDIWMSRRSEGQWSAPVAVAFDTPAKEFDPAFSSDGAQVYFFSNRPGGLGGDDIWSVAFDRRSGAFGVPVNLGADVNSSGDEWAPTPLPGGSGLLFATNGRGGQGRHDLFTSVSRGGAWQTAQALPGDVNSSGDDFDATFVADGRFLVFTRSDDADNAPIALWSAVREGDRYVRVQKLDARINVEGGWILGPSVDPANPGTLLFSGQRSDSTLGKSDIHAIHYRLHSD
jgi:TolB protein